MKIRYVIAAALVALTAAGCATQKETRCRQEPNIFNPNAPGPVVCTETYK